MCSLLSHPALLICNGTWFQPDPGATSVWGRTLPGGPRASAIHCPGQLLFAGSNYGSAADNMEPGGSHVECGRLVAGLTHWGRVTHVCVCNLTIIGSDNGLSPGWCQAIIWTNAGILLIEPLGTNLSEILIGIQTFSFKKMRFKIPSAKWHPFCLGLNVLTLYIL